MQWKKVEIYIPTISFNKEVEKILDKCNEDLGKIDEEIFMKVK